MKHALSHRAWIGVAALSAAAALTACGSDSNSPLAPASVEGRPFITLLAGDQQSTKVEDPALRPLGAPLKVLVTNSGGHPVAGAAVTFTVATGGGSIAGSPATSDANGVATSGVWTLGPTLGAQTVIARYITGNDTAKITFTARGLSVCDDRIPLAVGTPGSGNILTTDCNLSGTYADHFSISGANGAAYTVTAHSADFQPRIVILDALAANQAADTTAVAIDPSVTFISASTSTVRIMPTVAGATGAYTVSAAAASADVSGCQVSDKILMVGATTSQILAATDCLRSPGTGAQWNGNTTPYPGDNFRVWLVQGKTYKFTMTQNVIDAWLELFNPAGTRVKDNDEAAGGVAAITYAAPSTGWYTIFATSYGLAANDAYGKEYGAYTLNVVVP